MFARLWAVIAAVLFVIALLLHIVGGNSGKYVEDFWLAGFIFMAISLACWGLSSPWVRGPAA